MGSEPEPEKRGISLLARHVGKPIPTKPVLSAYTAEPCNPEHSPTRLHGHPIPNTWPRLPALCTLIFTAVASDPFPQSLYHHNYYSIVSAQLFTAHCVPTRLQKKRQQAKTISLTMSLLPVNRPASNLPKSKGGKSSQASTSNC